MMIEYEYQWEEVRNFLCFDDGEEIYFYLKKILVLIFFFGLVIEFLISNCKVQDLVSLEKMNIESGYDYN